MRLSNKYPFLTDYFTEVINSKKRPIPQAILFYGNDLESQYILSKEIARLLNCKENKEDDCNCLNCQWINADKHPAVMVFSKIDNKPDDDTSTTVISIKQSNKIKEILINTSEFHRVFIFCDKDLDGNILGLNFTNFQEETANSLLKIIEEPVPDVTFIFLTRYKDDVLSTIISRSQCFFVPTLEHKNIGFIDVNNIISEYWLFDRNNVFEISQKLDDLSKSSSVQSVLDCVQNYMLEVLKNNPKQQRFIEDIKYVENAKKQSQLGIKSINIFDELCLNIIK